MSQQKKTPVKFMKELRDLGKLRSVGLGGSPEASKIKAGLGARDGLGDFTSAVTAAINCPLFNMPVVEQVRWTCDGPQTDASITENFGSEIDLFGSGKAPQGISFVETTMAQPGQLQTYMITCGLFLHLEPEPLCFTAPGNAWTHPTVGSPQPPSPDVFTALDVANGALGTAIAAGTQVMVPAELEWGWWANYAMWNLVRGYNLRWKVGQQTNIMDEVARHSAYTPPNAQEGSASSSEVDIIEFVRRVNDYYEANGSTLDFLKINFIRVGSTGAGAANVGAFRPSRDLERVGATYGGMDLRSMLRGNSEFRKLSIPYLIKPGVPIGLILQENDTVQAQHMRDALSITLSDRAGAAIPPILTDAGNITASPSISGVAPVAQERTLDGLNQPQQVFSGRAVYKGGEFKISLGVKGFYVTDDWGDFLRASPDVQAAVAQDCGVSFA